MQLQGARGPISVKQSAAILDRLKQQGTTLLQRHVSVEEAVAQSPLVVGNRVVLLQDGPATYRAMLAAMQAAKDHINMQTYIIEDDEIGRRFSDLLLERRASGVHVNLIYDGVGSIGTPREFFDRLREGGVRVLQFNPVNPLTAKKGWQVNHRDHRKLLVVDGATAFIGGINISSVYSSGSSVGSARPSDETRIPWRDTHLQIEGPVVADFQKLFIETWTKQKGEPLPAAGYFPRLSARGKEIVRAIGGAANEPYSPIYVALLSAINAAEKSVHLTNAYFVPDPQLLAALTDAAARGADVKLILPGQTDFWAVFHAGRSYYADLLRAGVKIFERRGALLHAKTALIDGVWSCLGSTNLDWRSFLHNDELNAVVLGDEFSERMRLAFESDLAESDPVLLEEWERRPFSTRIKEWAARVWAYWL